jgi:predicted HicB family RNase H-like nuclease
MIKQRIVKHDKQVSILVRISEELHSAIKELAHKENISMSLLIEEVLEGYFYPDDTAKLKK